MFEKVELVQFYGKEIDGKYKEVMDIGTYSFDVFNKKEILKEIELVGTFIKVWSPDLLDVDLGSFPPKLEDFVMTIHQLSSEVVAANKATTNTIVLNDSELRKVSFVELYINTDFILYSGYKTNVQNSFVKVKSDADFNDRIDDSDFSKWFHGKEYPIYSMGLESGITPVYMNFPDSLIGKEITLKEYLEYV